MWENMLDTAIAAAATQAHTWATTTPEGKAHIISAAGYIHDLTSGIIKTNIRAGKQNVPSSEWIAVLETSIPNGSVAWSNPSSYESYSITDMTMKLAKRIAIANFVAQEKNRVATAWGKKRDAEEQLFVEENAILRIQKTARK